MKHEEPHIEFLEQKEESTDFSFKQLKAFDWSRFIMNNILFLCWITLLGFVYIGNRYHAEKIARNTIQLRQEVKELRAESITTAASLMYQSRQSVVSEMIKNKNIQLEEAVSPPYIIEK